MTQTERLIIEFMKVLHETDNLDFLECVLTSDSSPAMARFLKEAFKIERSHRPLLLEVR